MSLFGGHSKHPNFDYIVEMLRTRLGLQLARPGEDVLGVLDQMTSRELHQFENMHSVEGLKALFHARSIQALVEPHSQTVALFLATETELAAPPSPAVSERPVLRIGDRHATQSIVRPQVTNLLGTQAIKAPLAAKPSTPLPSGLEHLEAMEQLLPQLVDLFVRYGRLNSADKEVLKQIRPVDSSLEARLVSLDRWQTEVGRRVRGLHVQKSTTHVLLAAEEATEQAKPEETYGRRFDAMAIWVARLIKAFEHTGVKFHNKPMWLPHH